MILLAGCSSPPRPGEEAGPQAGLDDGLAGDTGGGAAVITQGTVSSTGLGSVVGNVSSDAGLLLAGVRVTLVEPGLTLESDGTGSFAFHNVTPGLVRMRAERDGFNVFEDRLRVVAGSTTGRAIVLVPLAGTNGGYIPHVHDYWAGRTEVTIVDEVFDLVADLEQDSTVADAYPQYDDATSQTLYANIVYASLRYRLPLERLEDPLPLVYPGTSRVEVTFSWDDAPPNVPHYALGYETAADTDFVQLEKHGPGVPWTIDVNQTQADNGHQLFSLWNFYIVPVNNAQAVGGDWRPALLLDAEVSVVIKVVRGSDPVAEPPHPRFWENGTRLVLRDETNATVALGPNVYRVQWFSLSQAKRIVPPGTRWLELELVWSYTDAAAGAAPAPPLVLHYNPGNRHWDSFIADWKVAQPVDRADPYHLRFNITLEPGENDGYYQARSMWRWQVVIDGNRAGPDGAPDDFHRSRQYQLLVTAVKDPALEVR